MYITDQLRLPNFLVDSLYVGIHHTWQFLTRNSYLFQFRVFILRESIFISKEDFSSRMAGAFWAKRGEWGLSCKVWDKDHLTLCVGVWRFARNIPPPGLAHKAPVKAGAFLLGYQLGDSDVWFLCVTVNCVCEKKKLLKKKFTVRLL